MLYLLCLHHNYLIKYKIILQSSIFKVLKIHAVFKAKPQFNQITFIRRILFKTNGLYN